MSDEPQAEDGGPAHADNSSPNSVRVRRHVRHKKSRTVQPLMCKRNVNLSVKSRKLHENYTFCRT